MKDYFKKNILYKNLYWAARCIVIKKKEPKRKKTMFLSFCFVCYKKTCFMGQNDSYMNQDRETKEIITCGKDRGMVMFRVCNKKTVVLSFRILFCLQKSVFTPPPPVAVSLAGWVLSLCHLCTVTVLHRVQS